MISANWRTAARECQPSAGSCRAPRGLAFKALLARWTRPAGPGAPPDGGTPNYMSPERIRSGGGSPEDDVYALGLTLLEMWTCRVPEPGYKPRVADQTRFRR